MKNPLYWIMLLSGVLIVLLGICFVYMYVNGAIIERLGEPDQSLLFWYLPVLFIGLAGLGLGVGLSILGVRYLRKNAIQIKDQQKEDHHE